MTEVQPLARKMVNAKLRASLYFNPQGGQCFAGVAQYVDPTTPGRTKQIVLSGKFLDANPPVHGDTVIDLESVDAMLQLDFPDPYLIYGKLVIKGTKFEVYFYTSLDPNDPEYNMTPSVLWGKIRPVNSGYIINTVQSTQPLSVSMGLLVAE